MPSSFAAGSASSLSAGTLAGMIDHTILKPDARAAEVRQFCEEARQHKFAAVCVNASRVQLAASLLRGSGVRTCAVVGFPLGAMPSAIKALETAQAVQDGADEIDMVIPVGALKDGDEDTVRDDIAQVRQACPDRTLKVILETCKLTDAEKRTACRLAQDEGADYVKTSTGFGGGGATEADIALMRASVGDALGVKASGGVRSYADALRMIAAGANRIGTSNGLAIITEAKNLTVRA